MKEEEIKLTDINRILIGEVPPEFFIELLIRLIITYIIAIVAMRLMGRRMAAQLSKNELAALVSIAAAIGVAIQAPDRGILPAIVVILVIIVVSKFMATRSFKSQKFEKISQGNVDVLVENSVLQLPTMKRTRISKERVFAQLRSEQIKSLGQVKRLYMEANGQFSILKENQPRPGLSVIPDWDSELIIEQEHHARQKVCRTCGYLPANHDNTGPCPHCHSTDWTNAVN